MTHSPWLPSRSVRYILLTALLPVWGCSSVALQQDSAAAVDVPAGWNASNAAGGAATGVTASSLTEWWRRFSDPALNDWVQRALQHNTRVLAAQAALDQAQAEADLAAAALGPALNANASAQHSTAGSHSSSQSTQGSLGASWVPDIFGVRRSALDAASANARASAASLGDVQVQVAGDVVLKYISLRSAQARLALAAETLANQQDTLQITTWRQQAGLIAWLDVEQARAAAAQTRALLPALQTSVQQGRHALAVLAGAPPASTQAAASEPALPALPVASDPLRLAIPAEALRQRADVRAAEYAVQAALARVGQARAQRWPSFAIGGNIGLNAATLGALGNSASLVSSLLASISLPVFDGGTLRAQVRVQQAALEQARQAHRAAVLGALKDVEDALVALQGDRLRLQSLRVAADAAGNASLLARQRFSSGLIDFQTVLDTQRSQFSAQDAVLGTIAELGTDHVRLFKALGGGWHELPLASAGPAP
jgi:NodT family efflux transporter outer membrane factor (OMF) lipoprotein